MYKKIKQHEYELLEMKKEEYYLLIQAYCITPSMSKRGNPYDNALAENFFSNLKTECIYLNVY